MEYLIFAVVLLAIWHWVYEAILVPSFRLELRFKLFKLRDEVRALKISHGENLDDRHFHYLQDGINNAIRLLPRLDVALFIALSYRLEHDKEFKARVDDRAKILKDCRIPEAVKIRKSTSNVVQHILGANSSGWIPYLIPIALSVAFYKRTKKLAVSLAALSEADIQAVAPDSNTRPVPA